MRAFCRLPSALESSNVHGGRNAERPDRLHRVVFMGRRFTLSPRRLRVVIAAKTRFSDLSRPIVSSSASAWKPDLVLSGPFHFRFTRWIRPLDGGSPIQDSRSTGEIRFPRESGIRESGNRPQPGRAPKASFILGHIVASNKTAQFSPTSVMASSVIHAAMRRAGAVNGSLAIADASTH
jgi:hypothetical protein